MKSETKWKEIEALANQKEIELNAQIEKEKAEREIEFQLKKCVCSLNLKQERVKAIL